MLDLNAVEPSTIAQGAGALVVATMGTIFSIQKLLKSWKETSTESNVIDIVNKQMTLMSQTNEKLAKEVSELQVEIISLNKQLRKLSDENQRLHMEVNSLTTEINRLQNLLEQKE